MTFSSLLNILFIRLLLSLVASLSALTCFLDILAFRFFSFILNFNLSCLKPNKIIGEILIDVLEEGSIIRAYFVLRIWQSSQGVTDALQINWIDTMMLLWDLMRLNWTTFVLKIVITWRWIFILGACTWPVLAPLRFEQESLDPNKSMFEDVKPLLDWSLIALVEENTLARSTDEILLLSFGIRHNTVNPSFYDLGARVVKLI